MNDVNYEQKLKEAIAILYETFAIYRLNSTIVGCPCCVSKGDNKLIQAKPLHKLTANDLNRYAFKAISTWGTIEDFKHFLPRLLELIAFDKSFLESDTVIDKLNYAKFDNWKKQEKKAVNDYLIALWHCILSNFNYPSILPSVFLNCLMNIKDDISSFLLIWENHSSINAVLHLSDFIQHEIQFNKFPIRVICLSKNSSEIFLSWLQRSIIIEKLEKAFFENIDQPYAHNIASAIDIAISF